MNHLVSFAITIITMMWALTAASADVPYKVYVDKDGVMRRSDSHAEVSYYGVNYTVPFAHAYRALDYLGVDHKAAIDRDVYHLSRLGFNAFRLHLWDVELSDSVGNLVENEHLDLLDYLIAALEKRGMKITLTAQTNFGNGYPERNTDPNHAYSYDYDKCSVHDNPRAIAAQERYVTRLLKHRNRYTGLTYASDPEIIALEINNEPCHSGTAKEVERYVDKMVRAVRKTGWDKIVLYNVSHNTWVTQAFYNTDIDGTTYQWYPLNLVAGHTRHGNYLPFVDEYDIPFASTVRNFDKKAKFVYEFDPADNLYSYLYPAMARSFRKAGFQWITQFAYDSIDMAWANSEYQTHFLNLAYTPRKALSMMIAAEAARKVGRYADYGKYPKDTVFGDFMVSARRDWSILNDGCRYFYTNSNDVNPKSPATLEQVAGWGNSPVVSYDGTGAYFLDRLADGVWRLEVMPDVVLTSDPFARPSLSKHVGEVFYRENAMTIHLPALGRGYRYKAVNEGNVRAGQALDGSMTVYPGVYLLAKEVNALEGHRGSDTFRNMRVGEYVAPRERYVSPVVVHTPQRIVEEGKTLSLRATVASTDMPDSVVVYPSDVSMWSDRNRLYTMKRVGVYEYETNIDITGDNKGKKDFSYNIVVFGKNNKVITTFPQGVSGTPLDWDFLGGESGTAPTATFYHTEIVNQEAPTVLFEAKENMDGTELSSVPSTWEGMQWNFVREFPIKDNTMRLDLGAISTDRRVVITKYVGDLTACRSARMDASAVHVSLGNVTGLTEMEVSLVNRDGFTYSATVPLDADEVVVPVSRLKLSPTLLCPDPYPVFLGREFVPDASSATPMADIADVEKIVLVFPQKKGDKGSVDIKGAWIGPHDGNTNH